MKRLILITLLAISSNLNAKSCTEAQIGNMIKQNLSQKTIDAICKEETVKKEESSKQIIVNITNAPVNNNVNTNTVSNTPNKEYETKSYDKREYFFWRVGFGTMTISDTDWSESSGSFGLQYFVNGLKDDGFGIGYAINVSSQEYETYNSSYGYTYYTTSIRSISTSELEIMYNFNIGNDFTITPTYSTGSTTQDDDGIITFESDIHGYGIYLNFPSIVKAGRGLSLFVKKISIEKSGQDMTLTGLQFVW